MKKGIIILLVCYHIFHGLTIHPFIFLENPDTPDNLKMKVGEMTIIVKEGNILKERCDAIINSSNNSMDLTRGNGFHIL